jgi:hypothetical protein
MQDKANKEGARAAPFLHPEGHDWERVCLSFFRTAEGEPTGGWISTWRLRVRGGWLYRTHEQAGTNGSRIELWRFEPTETFVCDPSPTRVISDPPPTREGAYKAATLARAYSMEAA